MIPPWVLLLTLIVALLVALFVALRYVIWRGGRTGISALQFLFGWLARTPIGGALRGVFERASRHFPRTAGFLAGRFARNRFTGLPLTLMVIAALYIAAGFTDLAEDVGEAKELQAVDRAANTALTSFRSTELIAVFTWVTGLGSTGTLSMAAIVATGFLWSYGRRRYIGPLWLCIVGSHAVTWGGKYLFQRVRPEFVTGVEAASPSFPSGHATGALAVYGFIAFALVRDLENEKRRFDVVYWSVAWIGLVAFSRVFLAVHYLSDIVAGLLVGAFWLVCGVAYHELVRTRGDR